MSTGLTESWMRLGRGTRIAAIGAATLALALLMWLLFRALQEDYGVLFSDLAPSDAAVIVERLKKDKTPYRIEDRGTRVSVPADQVHEVRLGLMSGDLPLSGGVGFEVFDKQGLGATEHSQKVSYQRALQGELARTIGALDHVKQVRVHLVLPESTLFTRDRQEASAAVTVAMEPGMSLERQQISGVQRLVAAAVPGLDPARVVVADHRGVTLSAADSTGVGTAATEARLQVKRDIEDYLALKVARLLDSAFGPGQAIVSIDATLNFDASKTTIQDLLPATNAAAGEGRVVRRRQVTGASGGEPVWTDAADGLSSDRTPSSSLEIEYQYGKRIEEVITAPGALTRMSVGVIVPGALTEEHRARITELVRVVVGISDTRGDAISVQSLAEMTNNDIGEPSEALTPDDAVELEDSPAPIRSTAPLAAIPNHYLLIACGALLGIALLIGGMLRSRKPQSLSNEDRQRILDEIQRTLSEDSAVATGRTRI